MSHWIIDFFLPYFLFARAAAHPFLENIQGLGLDTYWYGPAIWPERTLGIYSALLMLSLAGLAAFSVTAVWLHTRKTTWWLLVAVLWLVPGILNLFGLNIAPSYHAYHFVVGLDSYSGDPLGTACFMAYDVVVGWVSFMVLMGILDTGIRFRLLFDHAWFLTGIAAAIFFVVASGATGDRDGYAEANRDADAALAIFDGQLTNIVRICDGPDGARIDRETCKLSRGALITIRDWRYEDPTVRSSFRAPTIASMFNYYGDPAGIPSFENFVATKIDALNAVLCGAGSWYHSCDYLPIGLKGNTDLIPSDGSDYTERQFALDLRELLPTLSNRWFQSAQAAKGIEDAKKWIHVNWLYFALFAIFTGGRIALATRLLLVAESAGFANRDFRQDWERIQSVGSRSKRWVLAVIDKGHQLIESIRHRPIEDVDSQDGAD